MANKESDIREFHEKYGIKYNGPPRMLEKDLVEFRILFLGEELREYIMAVDRGDIAGAFDALVDLVYVAMGTAYLHGFPFDKGWDEVQRANMEKIRAPSADHSKRNSPYDVVKPEGWEPPLMMALLEEVGYVKPVQDSG